MADNIVIPINKTVDISQGTLITTLGLQNTNDQLIQGQSYANVLNVSVNNNGVPVELSGECLGYFVRQQDGSTVTVAGTISGNMASVEFPPFVYAFTGRLTITLSVGGTDLVHIATTVRLGSTFVIVDPGNVLPNLDEIQQIMLDVESALNQLSSALTASQQATQAANTAAGAANTAASTANTAAGNANAATTRANEAAASIEGMTVEASDVSYDQPATATVTDVEGHKHIAFGLRQGVPGAVPNITFTGETGEPNTDVVITQSGPPEAPIVNLKIPQGVPGTGSVSAVDGVVSDSGGNVALSAVRYVAQTLEDEQKVQARKNIGVDGQVYTCTAQALEKMSQEQQAQLFSQGYRVIKTENNGTVVLLGLASDGSLKWLGCNKDTTNSLDNPNFAIAQAGYGGLHGAQKYAADRWKDTYGHGTFSYANPGITMTRGTNDAYAAQVIAEMPEPGTYVTAAVLTDEFGELVGVGTFNTSGMQINVVSDDDTFAVQLNAGTFQCVVTSGSVTIRHARLLLGSYTAKTLPPWYTPNKTLETLKCQYFAQILSSNSVNAIDLRPTMRLSNPTITQISSGKYLYSCDL